MGIDYEYECKCGYKKMVAEGSGMELSWESVWLKSAMCKDCQEIITIIDEKENPQCDDCKGFNVIPYSDTQMTKIDLKSIEDIGDEDIDEMDRDELIEENTSYKCPKCHQYNMVRFTLSMWD